MPRVIVCAVCMTLLFFSCTCDGVPRGFFDMPSDRRVAEFEKYDFDTQYKIFICGQQKIEPPQLELAWRFACEGGRIVQPLEAKLENADDELTIRDIVLVFRAMNDLGTYDVAGDKSLTNKLRDKVSTLTVKDPFWWHEAEDNLLAIQKNSAKNTTWCNDSREK